MLDSLVLIYFIGFVITCVITIISFYYVFEDKEDPALLETQHNLQQTSFLLRMNVPILVFLMTMMISICWPLTWAYSFSLKLK
jgi:hypothetical protein